MIKLSSKPIEYIYTKSQNKLLSFTLLWFSLAAGLIVIVASIISLNVEIAKWLNELYIKMGIPWFIGAFVLYIIVTISFSVLYARTGTAKLIYVVPSFIFIVLFNVFILAPSFALLAIKGEAQNLIPIFAIPVGGMAIMGVLGYLQIFNFGKIFHLLIFSTILFIIYFFVAFSVMGTTNTLNIIFGAIGIVIFLLWTGFDMYMLRTRQKEMAQGNYTTSEYISVSLFFAFRLFIDFVQLLYYALSIFSK